jgi:hypothetical protein
MFCSAWEATMGHQGKPASAPEKVEIDEIRTIEALEARTFGTRFLRFNAEFTLIRKGISLCVELVHYLGDLPPKDAYDRVQRDLACDTIDSLWLAEHSLLRGYENHTLALLRRAYETTSLVAYFFNFPEEAKEWEGGKRIRQSHIRNALGTAPVPESKDSLDQMYRVYSLFTHVNRETVYHRMLGEENRLTLGCQGNANEEIVASVLRELLRQTMWFVDVANFTFAKAGLRPPEDYAQKMLRYRDEVQNLAKKLPALFPEYGSSKVHADTIPKRADSTRS